MLTTAETGARARRPRRVARSLRQEYEEFLFQRIEEYKNSLSRAQLLEIGDEAVRELETAAADQYLLTEVLLLEHVDRIIMRRLRLPTFQRWSRTHRALRAAQREPTHWEIEAGMPLVHWARRLEPGDAAVVIGATALPAALFVAAHDVEVLLLDQELAAVEAAEARAVSEQLAGRFHALVVQFGSWMPDVPVTLAVVHPAALAALDPESRRSLVTDLQTRTPPSGVHIVLPWESGEDKAVIPIATDTLLALYESWQVERRPRGRRGGFAATKPAGRAETEARQSE
ncbi:MAG TPA: hypothetical protein VL563_05400 [Gemmatimonadales bacterium]|nr:hypothetical protein [Gemmatimonadales bacterium]